MLVRHIPLVFLLGLVRQSTAQDSTASATSVTAGTHNGTTTFPANGTVTLSANGTATATIVNGTTVTQTSTSASSFPTLGGISPCVVNCLQASVSQANCSSITDEACFCSSVTFRNSTVNCVSTQCPSQLQGAEALAQQFCHMVSVTLTFPSSTPTTSTATTASGKSGAQHSRRPAILAVSSVFTALAWFTLGW